MLFAKDLLGRSPGADILFVESPESRDEMAEVCRSLKKPCIANMADGGRTPILPAAELQELGYALAIWPALGFLSMGAALQKAYADLKANGETSDAISLRSLSRPFSSS